MPTTPPRVTESEPSSTATAAWGPTKINMKPGNKTRFVFTDMKAVHKVQGTGHMAHGADRRSAVGEYRLERHNLDTSPFNDLPTCLHNLYVYSPI
ncbi:MAG: plastocyanin [Planctomycetota bacterium]|jgi:plastocyanin